MAQHEPLRPTQSQPADETNDGEGNRIGQGIAKGVNDAQPNRRPQHPPTSAVNVPPQNEPLQKADDETREKALHCATKESAEIELVGVGRKSRRKVKHRTDQTVADETGDEPEDGSEPMGLRAFDSSRCHISLLWLTAQF